MERVYAPSSGLFKTVFRAQGLKFTIVGEDHVPLQGGAVMAINHTSYFDFTYAGLGAQKNRRAMSGSWPSSRSSSTGSPGRSCAG